MSATAVKGSRLRKVECSACGCIARMSRAAMSRSGVPFCGCGAGRMGVADLEDALRVLPYEDLEQHPDFRVMAARDAERAIRENKRVDGGRLVCGGCCAFIPATNHDCRCGFSNDIRSGRNVGRWVEGASRCKEWESEQKMPF